jgi:hypothetical protein
VLRRRAGGSALPAWVSLHLRRFLCLRHPFLEAP